MLVLGPMLILSPSPVFASIGCGATITTNTTLSADIGPCSGNGLSLGASNIVLDCAGHTIIGDGTISAYLGIDSDSIDGVVVKDCIVSGFVYGFVLTATLYSTLENNSANGNGIGFQVETSSSLDTLVGNSANNDSDVGIQTCCGSSEITVQGNIANGNGNIGIVVNSNSDGEFQGNTANGNANNGFAIDAAYRDDIRGNTADNNMYGFNLSINSNDNTLTGNTAEGNYHDGFTLTRSSGNILTSNKANGNLFGYYDETSGSHTSGTANTYARNTCEGNLGGGSYPSGLCPPFIVLSLSSGLAGVSVAIMGGNFITSHGLTITHDGSTAGMPTTCTTNASGDINSGCVFTVPSSSPLGSYTIAASDGTNSPTATFTVTYLGLPSSGDEGGSGPPYRVT